MFALLRAIMWLPNQVWNAKALDAAREAVFEKCWRSQRLRLRLRLRQASSVKRQASSVKRQASSVKRQASSVKRQASRVKGREGQTLARFSHTSTRDVSLYYFWQNSSMMYIHCIYTVENSDLPYICQQQKKMCTFTCAKFYFKSWFECAWPSGSTIGSCFAQ